MNTRVASVEMFILPLDQVECQTAKFCHMATEVVALALPAGC